MGADEALGGAPLLVDAGETVRFALRDTNSNNYHSGYIVEAMPQGDFLRLARLTLGNGLLGGATGKALGATDLDIFLGLAWVPSQAVDALDGGATTYAVGIHSPGQPGLPTVVREITLANWNGAAMGLDGVQDLGGTVVDVAITRSGSGAACLVQAWAAHRATNGYLLLGEWQGAEHDVAGTLLIVTHNETANLALYGYVGRYGDLSYLPGQAP